MKKLSGFLLTFSLVVFPVVASAQPVVKSTQYKMTSVGPKKIVKKAVKKAVKSNAISSTATADCTIKGNISATKEKIFHVLGCPNYGQTVIDTTKGERMFCSEQEAKDAGWRKALNCP